MSAPAAIEISEVRSRRDRNAFIKFPWRVYRNDPAWVPPVILERKQFMDRRKHPFFRHGEAAFFLARRDGEIVGRIAASDDPNYNAEHKSNVGCFGFFECIEDQAVANALFETAEKWLTGRGRDEVIGPIDYSTNYVCALLVDGFQHPPVILTGHNPPYYAPLIESGGFVKEIDWYAWWIDQPETALRRLQRIASRFAKQDYVTLRPGNLKEIDLEAKRLRQIYNQAWQKNWGFVPFTEAEFDHMQKEMLPILRPEDVWIAESKGEPVGFILCLPNIYEVLPKINGRLTRFGLPIGLAKLLYYKNRLKTGRLIALGVIERFRGLGVAEMLILRIIEEAMVKKGTVGEMSMTLENNVMVNRLIEAMGAKRYKTYRIYRKKLQPRRP